MQQTTIKAEELFGDFLNPCASEDCREGFEKCWQWPEDIGSGTMSMIMFRPGLILGIGNYRLKEDINVSFEHEHPLVDLGFSVSGNVRYSIDHEKGQENFYHYKNGHSTINCLPSCQGCARSSAETHIACVRIYLDPTVLNTLLAGSQDNIPNQLHDIVDGNNEKYYCHASVATPLCNLAVQQILDCPYQDSLRRLYLESKTLELITHSMAQFLTPEIVSNKNKNLCPDDMERIRLAEQILTRNLENPPSLIDLARQVGLNKNKLNQGFRQQFGTSVFDYLRILRLEQARKLLESKEKNVTEAAFAVGYNHHGNFSRAFKKHFGTNPQTYLG